ncbi:host cell division inhibitor Icd-like protein [Escherichia coli]|uniref:host cell division inhibitor Icd-like protein n=1 Tax=Escherichia coli TaxID=562 RepID=UPI00098B7C6F|nr:host cell division inhibitor Icd-like protein [Escherichia coli]EHE8501159.1 ash family protein [Escherichia coli]EIS3582708.1 host cell division inhibitor Icd-like protein [Escherichia coli]EKM4578965.1 host cell division inhibitor Icd-like protein [Escherichia coli]EKO5059853.1 host cell division inhibitor Icd-like protein [Escherichia coli]
MILNEPAAQKEAFNLASLLTNVNPYNLIKPKVANGCLLSIVMVNDLAKLSLNLTKPDIHARGMTTNDDILNQEIITSKKLIVGNKFPLLAGGMNWIATVVNRSTSTFATNTRALEDLLGVVTREGEYSESIKKGSASRSDHQHRKPCYISPAGVNPPAGRENLFNEQKATQTRPASFFVSCHRATIPSGKARTVSMVALVGQPKGWPVSFCAGFLTPASVTAPYECENSGGDSLNLQKEAAIMATTPTQKPQFIWIIAAVRRDCPTITAKIHHIAAETEQEARRSLAREHVTFFAGRIRQEVRHA